MHLFIISSGLEFYSPIRPLIRLDSKTFEIGNALSNPKMAYARLVFDCEPLALPSRSALHVTDHLVLLMITAYGFWVLMFMYEYLQWQDT